jgi:hypothetical protein
MKGDLYMNRIAFAVKSALGLAILLPPSLSFAEPAADNSSLDEIVVTGIRNRHGRPKRQLHAAALGNCQQGGGE